MKIDLTPQKNRYRCSIYVDIDRISSIENIDDLDINQDQRVLSETPFLETYLKGSITSLYHIFGVFRVRDDIPRTVARIISAGWKCQAYDIDNEENVKARPISVDIPSYLPSKPRGIVTSIWKDGLSEHEKVGVHLLHSSKRHMLQYSYTDGDSAGLLRRAEKLMKHKRVFTISNKLLRDMLDIA